MELQVIITVELALILLVLMGSKEKEHPFGAKWRDNVENHLESIDDHMQMAEKSLHSAYSNRVAWHAAPPNTLDRCIHAL